MAKKSFTFTNSAGDVFSLSPANPLEEQIIREQLALEWKAAGKALPELPTYPAETVTGEVQHIPVDTAEKAVQAGIGDAWLAYKQAQAEFEGEHSARYLNSLFLSVQANPDDYPLWRRHMRIIKTAIPANEDDKFLLFCRNWVIRSTDDISDFVFAVSSTMANVSDEVLEATKARFRAVVEKAAAEAAGAAGG